MRVLIVEDLVKMASLIRRGLRKEGMAADVAITGEDALWMAEATEYDAIVLDVMLPGIDGFEVCRRLRADGVWSPILMLTARDAIRDRVAGLDVGADDYLTKPFSYAELLARLRALVRRGPVERPTELQVGELRLDPARRKAWRGKTEIDLSPKEFSILETFMRRPGRCSRASSSSSTHGTTTTRTAPTWSTPTSASCGRRSTGPSTSRASRPCAAPAIACARTAAVEQAADPAPGDADLHRRHGDRARRDRDLPLRATPERARPVDRSGSPHPRQRPVQRHPRERPGPGEASRSILKDRRTGFAQVLTADGHLFDPHVQSGPPVLDPATVARAVREPIFLELPHVHSLGTDRARLFATSIGFEHQRIVVAVGASLAERDNALSSLQTLLLIGGPVALLLSALAAYGTVAAALRPVEAMRAQAAEISDEPGEHRLPVPPAQDELQRLGETLNQMLERLDTAIQRERSFVDDASHELRTPLALHKAELELALRYGGTQEELRTSIASAIEEADRLTQLAEDLLVVARADKGGLPIERRPLQVAELFGSVRGVGRRLAESGRPLAVDDSDRLVVEGDRGRLEQALGNLVENALCHGAGPIRLWARTGADGVQLHVSDGGPGFPEDFLPHAFERFRRADVARSEGGSGLGLAIVEAIAAAHGGRAGAANTPRGGADVWIELSKA